MPNTEIRYFDEDKITARLNPGDKARLDAVAKWKKSTVAGEVREMISKQLLLEETTMLSNKTTIDAKVRKLLMDQLKRHPKLTVLKAARQAAKTDDLPQPVAHQLQLLIRKCESRKDEDKRAVKEYLEGDLCLKVDPSQNQELLLYTEAYDEETWDFPDDFAMLNPELRDYLGMLRDEYPEASCGKVVELAAGVEKPGAQELLGMDEKELEELFANSSIG